MWMSVSVSVFTIQRGNIEMREMHNYENDNRKKVNICSLKTE